MSFADSHCHLNFRKFDVVAGKAGTKYEGYPLDYYSVDSVISRAREADVKYMLTIGTVLSEIEELQIIAEKNDGVFQSVGIHPQEAQKHLTEFSLNDIEKIISASCAAPKTVAIGEIGLDYHFEKESEEKQKILFNLQLDIAEKQDLPVSIHSRDAIDDTVAILREHSGVQGVLHCFSGERDFARDILDLGFYIAVGGAVTFKNSEMLRETLKFIPLDRLLLETDAPFLAPVPMRGKANESAFIPFIAKKVAEVHGMEISKVEDATTENFFAVFKGAVL